MDFGNVLLHFMKRLLLRLNISSTKTADDHLVAVHAVGVGYAIVRGDVVMNGFEAQA